MADEQGAIPEALERLFDQAFADGIAAGKSGDESILAGSSTVYAQSALTIVAADRLTDTGATVPLYTFDEAWDELVNKDDRTSPEEYPDMCLITRDELRCYMEALQYAPAALATHKTADAGAMRLDFDKVSGKISSILADDPVCNGRVSTGSIARIAALVVQAETHAIRNLPDAGEPL